MYSGLHRWWNKHTPWMLVAIMLPVLFALASIGGIAMFQDRQEHLQNAQYMLQTISEIRAQQIEQQFDNMVRQARSLSENIVIQDALRHLGSGAAEIEKNGTDTHDLEGQLAKFTQELKATPDDEDNDFVEDFDPDWRNVDRVGRVLREWYIYNNPHAINHKFDLDRAASDSLYNREHAEYHPTLRKFMEEFGYFDVMLVAPDGRIVYTVYKEMDFATNVFDGPYKDTGMARIALQALRVPYKAHHSPVFISDMEPYYTTVRDIGLFIASPVFDDKGERLGVLILQVPVDKLTAPLHDRSGLGQNGDIFVIGQDQVMRTPHNTPNGLPALAHNASPMAHMIAIGKRGIFDALNRAGAPILVAARSLDLPQLEWIVVVQDPYSEIYGLTNWRLDLLLPAVVLILLLSTLIALLMARFMPLHMVSIDPVVTPAPPAPIVPAPELNALTDDLHKLNLNLSEHFEMQGVAIFQLNRAFAALAQQALQDVQAGNDINIALTGLENTVLASNEALNTQNELIKLLKKIVNSLQVDAVADSVDATTAPLIDAQTSQGR